MVNSFHCFGDAFHVRWSKLFDELRQYLTVLIDGKLPTGCGKALEASLPDVAELEINLKPSPCLEELLSRLVLEPKRLTNGLTAQATEIINDTGFEHTIQGYCKNYLTTRVLIHGDLRENETLFKKVWTMLRIWRWKERWDFEDSGKTLSESFSPQFEMKARFMIAAFLQTIRPGQPESGTFDAADTPTIAIKWNSATHARQ